MNKFYPKLYQTRVKVGLFTVIMLAVLVVGYLWLSNRISVRSQRDLKVNFTDVMGLEVGDKAMFRGMEVGRIKRVEAKDDQILVTARVNSDITLNAGARFIISDSSLMGGTALNIAQGEGPGRLDLAKIQRGDPPAGIMSILGKANTTVDELNGVLAELRQPDGLLNKSNRLLDSADSAARGVDRLSLDANSALAASLARLDELTGRINRIVNSNEGQVNELLAGTPAAMGNLNGTLDSLRALSGQLGQTVADINSGKGTAGKLMNDAALYERLLTSVANLDSLIADVREHPKKYVKFSLF